MLFFYVSIAHHAKREGCIVHLGRFFVRSIQIRHAVPLGRDGFLKLSAGRQSFGFTRGFGQLLRALSFQIGIIFARIGQNEEHLRRRACRRRTSGKRKEDQKRD
ncbi:MAG: hypothetical protein ACLPX9_05575 [Rhodomicrobium sp.]